MSVTERLWSCICCLQLSRGLESAFVNKSSSHRSLGTWVWVVLFINFSEVGCPKLVNSAFFRADLSATSLLPPLSSLPCLHPFPGVLVLVQLSCIMSWKSTTKICKSAFQNTTQRKSGKFAQVWGKKSLCFTNTALNLLFQPEILKNVNHKYCSLQGKILT